MGGDPATREFSVDRVMSITSSNQGVLMAFRGKVEGSFAGAGVWLISKATDTPSSVAAVTLGVTRTKGAGCVGGSART